MVFKASLLPPLLAVLLIIGAAAPLTATATELDWHAETTRWFVEKEELPKGKTAGVEGTVETAQLVASIGGVEVAAECGKNKPIIGTLEEGGKSSGWEASLEGCIVDDVTKGNLESLKACKIKEPLALPFKGALVINSGGVVENEIKPASGTTFATIKIEGASCVLKGEFKIEGSTAAALDAEGEEENPEHQFYFTSDGSKLTLKETAASITVTMSLKR
jgi:hypothetical protein